MLLEDLNPLIRYRLARVGRAFRRVELVELGVAQHLAAERPPSHPPVGAVDVVVPIFNGADSLGDHLATLSMVGCGQARLCLVNDASTDPRVGILLQSFCDAHPGVVLISNAERCGVVGVINAALQRSQGHVVVLELAAVLPPGWLDRLLQPMLVDARVATAMPFTSVDLHENGEDPGAIDQAYARLPLLWPPRMHPGASSSGCIAFNKAVWASVGPLDRTLAWRGGAEVDWCMRALYKGFRHVVANNLFVPQVPMASLSAESCPPSGSARGSRQRLSRHAELVDRFVKTDPFALLNGLARFWIKARDRQIDLIIDHDFGGGANAYRRQEIERRLGAGRAVVLYGENRKRAFLSFHAPAMAERLDGLAPGGVGALIGLVQPREIIYNNLVGARDPLAVLAAVTSARAVHPCVLTILIHDFFPVCPAYNLLNDAGRYCGVPDSLRECRRCLPRVPDTYSAYKPSKVDIARWRQVWGDVMMHSSEVRCFSRSSADIVLSAYPQLRDKITVVPHEVHAPFAFMPQVTARPRPRIGVIGGLNYCKGQALLQQLEKLSDAQGVDFVVIGETDPRYPLARTRVTGRYQVKDLPSIIEAEGIEFVFISSVWPETFSYVTGEAMALGVGVFCLPLGAPAERVRHYDLGRVSSSCEPETVLKELLAFRLDLKSRRQGVSGQGLE